MSSIKNLENEIQNEINIANDKNINLLLSKTYSEIQQIIQEFSFLLQDSFYNQEDKTDETYNKLLEEEKKIVLKTFYSNQSYIKSIISKDNKLNSIPNIRSSIINKIVKNKDSFEFIKNKLINKIKKIAEDDDDERFKLKYLTILLVGRKGIGKTTLIKYILGDNTYEESMDDINNNYFVLYTSQEIKYLRIIEVKGLGYDNTPEKTKKNIENLIEKNNKKNSDNYNDVIHCILFCVSETRLEKV